MKPGTVLRWWREARGFTQKLLGKRIGASEFVIRGAETNIRPLTPELASRAARVLGAPEIPFAVCMTCPANLLLDLPENVDTHPVVQLLNTLEETREVVAGLEALDLRNKARLEGPALAALERVADQLLDLPAAVAKALAVWSRQYGLDLLALLRHHHRKLVLKGYCAQETDEAGALPRLAEGVAP